MKPLKNSFIYLKRNRGRSLILFAVIAVMIFVSLICSSLKASADNEIEKFRSTLGSSFSVGIDLVLADQQGVFQDLNGDGVAAEYTGPSITDELKEKILDIPGVEKYYAERQSLVIDFDLELYPGYWTDYINQDMREEFADYIKAGTMDENDIKDMQRDQEEIRRRKWTSIGYPLHVSDSEMNEFFVKGAFELAEGRHVRSDDEHVAVISSYVAEKNGLSVGDSFTPRNLNPIEDYRPLDNAFPLEIIGIYDVNFSFEDSQYTDECFIPENMMFTDFSTYRDWRKTVLEDRGDVYDPSAFSYDGLTFYVSDPKNMDRIIDEIFGMPDLDWDYCYIEREDSSYDAATKPLKTLSDMSTSLLVVVIVSCVFVLFLLLKMWNKSREKETKVYYSLGINKRYVISQRVLECLFIAIAAALIGVLLAVCLTAPIGSAVENGINASNSDVENFAFNYNDSTSELFIENTAAEDIALSYTQNAAALLACALSGVGIVVFLAWVSCTGIYKKLKK